MVKISTRKETRSWQFTPANTKLEGIQFQIYSNVWTIRLNIIRLDSWHPKEKVDFENILIFKIISISSKKYLNLFKYFWKNFSHTLVCNCDLKVFWMSQKSLFLFLLLNIIIVTIKALGTCFSEKSEEIGQKMCF